MTNTFWQPKGRVWYQHNPIMAIDRQTGKAISMEEYAKKKGLMSIKEALADEEKAKQNNIEVI